MTSLLTASAVVSLGLKMAMRVIFVSCQTGLQDFTGIYMLILKNHVILSKCLSQLRNRTRPELSRQEIASRSHDWKSFPHNAVRLDKRSPSSPLRSSGGVRSTAPSAMDPVRPRSALHLLLSPESHSKHKRRSALSLPSLRPAEQQNLRARSSLTSRRRAGSKTSIDR